MSAISTMTMVSGATTTAIPYALRMSGSVSSSSGTKQRELSATALQNCKAILQRLGQILCRYESWEDPLSLQLFDWGADIFVEGMSHESALEANFRAHGDRLIQQLAQHILVNPITLEPLQEPVLLDGWVWEKWMLEDYCSLFARLDAQLVEQQGRTHYSPSVPLSPFPSDEGLCQPLIASAARAHSFAIEILAWLDSVAPLKRDNAMSTGTSSALATSPLAVICFGNRNINAPLARTAMEQANSLRDNMQKMKIYCTQGAMAQQRVQIQENILLPLKKVVRRADWLRQEIHKLLERDRVNAMAEAEEHTRAQQEYIDAQIAKVRRDEEKRTAEEVVRVHREAAAHIDLFKEEVTVFAQTQAQSAMGLIKTKAEETARHIDAMETKHKNELAVVHRDLNTLTEQQCLTKKNLQISQERCVASEGRVAQLEVAIQDNASRIAQMQEQLNDSDGGICSIS